MRRLITALCLISALNLSIFAGEVSTPGVVNPPPPPSASTAAGTGELTLDLVLLLLNIGTP